jgi:hypothetical protein
MDDNPYSEQLSWLPASEQHSYDLSSGQVHYHYPFNSQQGKVSATSDADNIDREKLYTPSRMPKEHAVSLASKLKQFSLVGSIALFGVFSGLIATHLHTATGNATSFPPPQHDPSNASPPRSDDQSDPNAQAGGFFKHHHRDGYGFGNGDSNGGSFQQPSTGTHVSGR